MLQSTTWFDTDQISRKQTEQWRVRKSSDCATKLKRVESRLWQFTLELNMMWPIHDVQNGCFIIMLTIFQRRSIDLWARGPCAGSVKSLNDHTVLSELLQVVQSVDLAVAGGFHLHNAVLAVTARAIFSITNLVTPDNAILQLFPGSLKSIKYKWKVSTVPSERYDS